MTDVPLPADVVVLLTTDLDSFEKLEIVRALWLRGLVSVDSLLGLLDLDLNAMRATLDELVHRGLVERVGRDVRLGPRALDDAFQELMRLHQDNRVAIVTTLAEIAMRRVRVMAARAFADVFVAKR